jgi:hypothetical protein
MRQAKRLAVENKLIENALQENGWKHKTNFGRPTCPNHVIEEKPKEEPMAPNTAPVINASPIPVAEPAPVRVPNLHQRRTILEELDLAYDVDKSRYSKGFTDEIIAKKHNFPRKWVSDIREGFFGVGDKNEEHEETIAKIETALKTISDAEERMFAELGKLEPLKKDLQRILLNMKK